MKTEEQLQKDRDYQKARYRLKKATDPEWYKRKLELSRLNYKRRQLKVGKYKFKNKKLDEALSNMQIQAYNKAIRKDNETQYVNVIKEIKPESNNYPVINRDYRIIKHINTFGDLCYKVQIRKSFLGIKYWSYVVSRFHWFSDKDVAKRTAEAYLYPSTILTEDSF